MPETLITEPVINPAKPQSKRGGRRVGAGRKPAQPRQAQADAIALTGSHTQASKVTGCAMTTLANLARSEDWPAYREQAAHKWSKVNGSVLDHVANGLQHLDSSELTPSQIQSLATTAAIGEDKIAKLTGMDGTPTNQTNIQVNMGTGQPLNHQPAAQPDEIAKIALLLLKSGAS